MKLGSLAKIWLCLGTGLVLCFFFADLKKDYDEGCA